MMSFNYTRGIPHRTLFLFLTLLLLQLQPSWSQRTPFFADVTAGSGITPPDVPSTKYGGPAVADLDNDGYPDLLFQHHDSHWLEVYYNTRAAHPAKAFTRAPPPWIYNDFHGINPAPRSAYTRNVIYSISVGGNYGLNPVPPHIYQSTPSRQISNITGQLGIPSRPNGRGRSAVFMHLKNSGYQGAPDLIVTNAAGPVGDNNHFAYANGGSRMALRTISDFQPSRNSYGAAIGINAAGNDMHLISWQELTIYKKVGGFLLRDVSNAVLPPGIQRRGVLAVAEFDYDNDGDFDLYIVRSNTGEVKWLPNGVYYDYLLENRNGVFVDVTARAGLLRNSKSRGVTTGDFNNDGFLDLYVAQYMEPDTIYINRGDGTFRRQDGLISRPASVRGDHAVAVDYDLDGNVDLIVSQGDWFDRQIQSSYRVYRNTGGAGNWLMVRVGAAPGLGATALHAIVRVNAGGKRMTRRVGSPGDNASKSYIQTVHFGIGGASGGVVTVTWPNGVSRNLGWVRAGSKASVGVLL